MCYAALVVVNGERTAHMETFRGMRGDSRVPLFHVPFEPKDKIMDTPQSFVELKEAAGRDLQLVEAELNAMEARRQELLTMRKKLDQVVNILSDNAKKPRNRSIKCEVCGEMFSPQGLGSHMKSHEPAVTVPV